MSGVTDSFQHRAVRAWAMAVRKRPRVRTAMPRCAALARWLAIAALALPLAAPTTAAPGTGDAAKTGAEWTLAALMQGLAQVKSAQARFVEQKTMSFLTQPLESSGTLAWRAPDRVEKRTLKPRAESLVLDRDQLIVEAAGRPRQVMGAGDQPIVWAFVEAIRSTLAGDLPTLEKYYRVRLEGRPARWTLVLVPLSERMRGFIAEIRITGAGARMQFVDALEANGDRTLMRIEEVAP